MTTTSTPTKTFDILQVADSYVVLDAGEDRVIHATLASDELKVKKGDTVTVTFTKTDNEGLPTDAVITAAKSK